LIVLKRGSILGAQKHLGSILIFSRSIISRPNAILGFYKPYYECEVFIFIINLLSTYLHEFQGSQRMLECWGKDKTVVSSVQECTSGFLSPIRLVWWSVIVFVVVVLSFLRKSILLQPYSCMFDRCLIIVRVVLAI
jgi:hypothetical protein